MPAKEECIQHIQKPVDLLYQFERWGKMDFVKALALGVQGKKREADMKGQAFRDV